MTTTETTDPIMAAFVERYAATRANAAEVASNARAITVQVNALSGDAKRVSGDYHLLKNEFRTSLQSIVGASGRDREVIDGSDAVIRAVTGYEDMPCSAISTCSRTCATNSSMRSRDWRRRRGKRPANCVRSAPTGNPTPQRPRQMTDDEINAARAHSLAMRAELGPRSTRD